MTQDAISSNYGDSFYKVQMDGSYKSASIVVPHLLKYFQPKSVVDLGCGRGTWLKAFKDNGIARVVGHDGPWNSQDKMIDPGIVFVPLNLNSPVVQGSEKFDLASSLEVAEHLKPGSAREFVKALTHLSDVVMFGAAYSYQGGVDHINEQPHTYWAKLFGEFSYLPYDIFRPEIWGNPDVESWYQQNTFLYVRKNSDLEKNLNKQGIFPLKNLEFMNCIHPQMYAHWVTVGSSPLRTLVKKAALKFVPSAVLSRLRNFRQGLTG